MGQFTKTGAFFDLGDETLLCSISLLKYISAAIITITAKPINTYSILLYRAGDFITHSLAAKLSIPPYSGSFPMIRLE